MCESLYRGGNPHPSNMAEVPRMNEGMHTHIHMEKRWEKKTPKQDEEEGNEIEDSWINGQLEFWILTLRTTLFPQK